jgi:hypothetical protein
MERGLTGVDQGEGEDEMGVLSNDRAVMGCMADEKGREDDEEEVVVSVNCRMTNGWEGSERGWRWTGMAMKEMRAA